MANIVLESFAVDIRNTRTAKKAFRETACLDQSKSIETSQTVSVIRVEGVAIFAHWMADRFFIKVESFGALDADIV